MIVGPEDVQTLRRDGVVVIRDVFPIDDLIKPLRRDIERLVDVALGEPLRAPNDYAGDESFDLKYRTLLKADRRRAGAVYDAVKHTEAFNRLVSAPFCFQAFQEARNAKMPAAASAGCGVRSNNPSEDRFLAPWHQDFHTQGRSPEGLVFWTPLVTVDETMGPVEFCIGSHKPGVRRVRVNPEEKSIYELEIDRLADELESWDRAAPLTKPGDLVLIDFRTIHRSQLNRSDRPLWSAQLRYFDLAETDGAASGWPGPRFGRMALADSHPQLVIQG